MSEIPNPDMAWDGVTEDMARQILQQADTFMQCQWQAAIAADQRAVTTASIFVAVATATVGGTLAYWHEAKEPALLAAGLVGSLFLVAGSALCFWSARPVDFFSPGNQPDQWWGCRTGDLVTCIGGETENYQSRIEQNADVLENNGRQFMLGVRFALLAPLLAVVAWGLTSFWGDLSRWVLSHLAL